MWRHHNSRDVITTHVTSSQLTWRHHNSRDVTTQDAAVSWRETSSDQLYIWNNRTRTVLYINYNMFLSFNVLCLTWNHIYIVYINLYISKNTRIHSFTWNHIIYNFYSKHCNQYTQPVTRDYITTHGPIRITHILISTYSYREHNYSGHTDKNLSMQSQNLKIMKLPRQAPKRSHNYFYKFSILHWTIFLHSK